MFSGEQHFRQDPTEVPQGGTDRAPYTNTEKKELIESLEDGIYPTHEKSETYGTAEFGGGLSVQGSQELNTQFSGSESNNRTESWARTFLEVTMQFGGVNASRITLEV